ncbi:MAG: glycosyl transferase family 1 [Chloroflexus sp.]|nr:glycosyl transferase family 1 [Chloroflexus sp.]
MSSLLIISHDVIGQRMAGPGIRMWELARVLARHLPVTLIAPQPIDLPLPANLRCGHYTWGDAASIEPYLRAATNIFANGYVASAHPELLNHPGCLIIDLYDPVALENLELFRNHPLAERQEQAKRDSDLLRALLTRGDHFVCATERQRDLYIGGLLALGRITPAIIDQDPLLHQFIAIVPFGVSDDPPQASGQPALRGVLDDLSTEHTIILWSGGLWDWMDPLTLVRAMPHVLAHVPTARLVFLAGRHPGQVPEMATVQQTRQLAADLGLLGCGVHFYNEWVPYQRRADFLLEAKVMVSLHRAHLETRYAAVRSRILDHFWVGRPSVVSADDAAADLIKEHQAGEVVPIGDSQAVGAVLIRLLTDHQHWTHQSANAAALGQRLRWSRVVSSLLSMLTDSHLKERLPMPIPDGSQLATLQRLRNDAIRVQEQLWKIESSLSPNPLLRFVQRNILQLFTNPQRDYNAAALRSMYALAEQIDQTTQLLFNVASQYGNHINWLDQRLQELTRQMHEVTRQMHEVTQQMQELSQRSDMLELRVTNLESGAQDHNHRQVQEIHQIGQQIRDFADQIVGLEETTSQILAYIGGVYTSSSQQTE